MVAVIFHRHLEMWHQDEFGLNDNSGIQFADQENILIDSNIVQIQKRVPKWNYFRFSGATLHFGVKESPLKVGIAYHRKHKYSVLNFIYLGGTEPDIHLRVIYPPPPNCNVRLKKYHCNATVKLEFHMTSFFITSWGCYEDVKRQLFPWNVNYSLFSWTISHTRQSSLEVALTRNTFGRPRIVGCVLLLLRFPVRICFSTTSGHIGRHCAVFPLSLFSYSDLELLPMILTWIGCRSNMKWKVISFKRYSPDTCTYTQHTHTHTTHWLL